MITGRSRNNQNNSNILDTKNSFNSNTLKIEDKLLVKSQILTNLTEYAGEARIIIQKNNTLKQIIALLRNNNLHTKNFINKIITINKDIKSSNKKNSNNNGNNLNKDNMYNIVKEYNDFIKNNNNILQEKIQKIKDKNANYVKDLEKEIEGLNKNLDESKNVNFMLENKNKYKENIIKDLFMSYQEMGYIQENIRYRFVNDELSQSDIDNFYSKFLAVFQQCLLNTTQNWNKYKNRAIKFEKEIENLKNLLENPEKINEKNEDEKIEEQPVITENDLLLLTFDEFEDESEATLETEAIETNEENKDNKDDKDDSLNISIGNNNENIIKINNINKLNNNVKYNKITALKNQSLNNRRFNRSNFIRRDIYYMPQKNLSKSLIKNSESMNKIKDKDFITFAPPIVNNKGNNNNNNRNISIDSISKLNLKQIVFNKKNKFLKEEAKEMALKRFKIENEYKINIPNNMDNPNDIKLKMEIKELKKDIKIFKAKKKKKRRLIKNFKQFCKDVLKKYDIYLKNSNCENNNNNNYKYNFNKINNISIIKKK